MRKLFLQVALALACGLGALSPTFGQTAFFTYTGVPSGPLTPGSSFTIDLNITFAAGGTINNLTAISYWMWQMGATAGNPNFAITNRDVTGSVFNMVGALTYPQVLDPINRPLTGFQSDLGQGGGPVGSGTYFLAHLTLQVLPTAQPGVYTISNTTQATPGVGGRFSVLTDTDGDTMAIPAAPFTVTVVPEPSTLVLLSLAGVVAAVGIWRRMTAA